MWSGDNGSVFPEVSDLVDDGVPVPLEPAPEANVIIASEDQSDATVPTHRIEILLAALLGRKVRLPEWVIVPISEIRQTADRHEVEARSNHENEMPERGEPKVNPGVQVVFLAAAPNEPPESKVPLTGRKGQVNPDPCPNLSYDSLLPKSQHNPQLHKALAQHPPHHEFGPYNGMEAVAARNHSPPSATSPMLRLNLVILKDGYQPIFKCTPVRIFWFLLV